MGTRDAGTSTRQRRTVSLLAVLVTLTGLQVWTWGEARWLTALAFGGDAGRVDAISARRFDDGGFVVDLVVACALLALAAASSAWAMRTWWYYGWRSGAQRKASRYVPLVPLASVAFGLLELGVSLATVDERDDRLHVGDFWAAVIAGLGQLKWFSLFLGTFALFLTIYGAVRFRRLSLQPLAPTSEVVHGPPVDLPVAGSAICLSGGGIRAASFAWGALAELERRRPLRQFDRLYSVSGGGYAAAAFTGAPEALRGAPKFFSDAQLPASGSEDRARYSYFRQHGQYLMNGRGGLPRALGIALGSILLNVFVIFLGVVVIAVPIGVLARNELGGGGMAVPGGVAWPVLVIAALALAALVVGALVARITKAAVMVSGLLLVGAAAIGIVRVVLPWMSDHAGTLLSSNWWKQVLPAAVVWVATMVFALVRPRLTKIAVRLGGLVSAAAMVAAAVVAVRVTVEPDRYWTWLGRDTFLDDNRWLLPLCAVALILVDCSGVQWWSLHPLYRDRLAGTFLFKRGASDTGLVAQDPCDWVTWLGLHEREERARAASKKEGRQHVPATPVHVVCAATHRRTSDVTGLRSISFTFSPEGVEMFEPARDPETGRVSVRRYHQDATWLDTAVGARINANKRSSVIATAAMSGAAFNSAMGRHSKGSTDSLMAVLNLRLGVWLPNPRFTSSELGTPGPAAFTRPGLRYLFHEVIGHYDITDPFVHVSDGGHWENLGLVEALRARHRHIVCIDASGDHFAPATAAAPAIGLGTLHEAIDLARIELHTEVRIDPEAFAKMGPDPRTGRCERNWMECDVVYHRDPDHDWRHDPDEHCRAGKLLFVKALVGDRTPESVLSFANTDRVFPGYSTGDQFLTDDQLRSLVGLGECVMGDAFDVIGPNWFTDPTPG